MRAKRQAERAATTASVLRILSSLAVDRRTPGYDVRGSGPTAMAWLGGLPSNHTSGDPFLGGTGMSTLLMVKPTDRLQGLQRYDALTPDSMDLRIGWLWIRGTVTVDGTAQSVLLPLLSRPVRVHQDGVFSRRIEPITAWDLWPFVTDPMTAADLEAAASFGGGAIDPGASQDLIDRLPHLKDWVRQVLEASGLPAIARIRAPEDPTGAGLGSTLTAIAGFGIYADQSADPSRPKETLAHWSVDPHAPDAVLADLYTGQAPADPPGHLHLSHRLPAPVEGLLYDTDKAPIASSFPLTDRQVDVIRSARSLPITVVSGPPGTGKSQTAAAVALDAVAHGRSVLIATQSAMAADVLADLLDRVPGPTPVLFGGGERSSKLASKLADGLAATGDDRARAHHARVADHARSLRDAVVIDLGDMQADATWRANALTLSTHQHVAPRLLDEDANATSDAAAELMQRARFARGVLSGWRRRRAERALRRLVGAPRGTHPEALFEAVAIAQVRDRARRITPEARAAAAERWQAFVAAERARRIARAEAVAEIAANRTDGSARRAVAALATALRAGRAARRSHLASIDVEELTKALPLWVGTLGDIEHLLPATVAAFDLVILDEASQIDQISASAALLRAKRAVVIGDPRQLRFVSFLSDDEVRAAIRTEGRPDLADRMDLRRVSAFDLAASAAPVIFLEDHFRSVPHLIGFSAHHFYDDRIHIATRHPRNDGCLAIELLRIDGERSDGINQAEVDHTVALVERLLAETTSSMSVISPYRPQVDAIRDAIGEQIPMAALEGGRVRVATVHASQGAESDIVIASFGLSGDGGRSRAFLEDPHLFNVMVTRARQRLIVLSSSTDGPTTGLLADYLRWAQQPCAMPPDAGPGDPWTEKLAEVLADSGVPVAAGYRVGRWVLDLVIGTGDTAMAVVTRVHPDGTHAHLQRHLALDHAGWRLTEAFPADFDGDPVATALALRDRLLPPLPRR